MIFWSMACMKYYWYLSPVVIKKTFTFSEVVATLAAELNYTFRPIICPFYEIPVKFVALLLLSVIADLLLRLN